MDRTVAHREKMARKAAARAEPRDPGRRDVTLVFRSKEQWRASKAARAAGREGRDLAERANRSFAYRNGRRVIT